MTAEFWLRGRARNLQIEIAAWEGASRSCRGTTRTKRIFDVVSAAFILLMVLPILCLIAILIKIESPGPVVFSQPRRGFGGRPFALYKFRTMYQEHEDHLALQQTVNNDSRVTRLGKFLRRYSFDELPQLYNVLRGEMSLVGPRPHALGTNISGTELPAVSDLYMLRYCVKPGMTGWAQVNGHRGILTRPEDLIVRLEHDLYYIRNWSIRLDFVVLMKTLGGIFRDNGAF